MSPEQYEHERLEQRNAPNWADAVVSVGVCVAGFLALVLVL